jgi:hypothetical protein
MASHVQKLEEGGQGCSRAHAGVAVVDDALGVNVGRAHLVDAAGVVRRVGHHEHPDPAAAGGELPPQRPRHRRGVLEHLVGELSKGAKRPDEESDGRGSPAAVR